MRGPLDFMDFRLRILANFDDPSLHTMLAHFWVHNAANEWRYELDEPDDPEYIYEYGVYGLKY